MSKDTNNGLFMNWYSFLKYSQNWLAYVKSIGVTDDDVQVLESIDNEKTLHIVINELRKKPGTTARQVLENLQPKREVEHTPWELRLANRFPSGELSKWILVQLRRLRKSPKDPTWKTVESDPSGLLNAFQTILTDPEVVKEHGGNLFNYHEIYGYGPGGMYQPTNVEEVLRSKTQEIIDWYNAERPQMASYTLPQAIEASDEWHERISSETDATSFEEGEKNIVYGPQWTNPEWNGWTVRRILTANDVQYEGYVMEHCVGSYDCDVVDEKTKIYSLRDPGNKPHVTMEVEVESWDFKQIHGKSNSEPKSEYKKMIGEWMKTLKNVVIGEEDDFDYSGLDNEYKEDIPDALYNSVFKANDYGIDTNLTYFKFDDAYRSVVNSLTSKSGHDWTSGADQIADTLVMATIEKDRSMIDYFLEEIEITRRRGEPTLTGRDLESHFISHVGPSMRDFETNDLISKIEEVFEQLDDNVFEASHQAAIEVADLSDEESEELGQEEFERRVEQHLEEQEKHIRKEYINESFPYALVDALNKELKNYLGRNPLPTYSWMKEIKGGPPKFTYYQVDSGEPKKARLVMNFYKRAQMYSADEEYGDEHGVHGHPDDYEPTWNEADDTWLWRQQKPKLSRDINDFLSEGGTTKYFDSIPIDGLFSLITGYGLIPVDEDGEKWQGMLMGEEGRTSIDLVLRNPDRMTVGEPKDMKLHLQWYKMPSGNFEINAYVS